MLPFVWGIKTHILQCCNFLLSAAVIGFVAAGILLFMWCSYCLKIKFPLTGQEEVLLQSNSDKLSHCRPTAPLCGNAFYWWRRNMEWAASALCCLTAREIKPEIKSTITRHLFDIIHTTFVLKLNLKLFKCLNVHLFWLCCTETTQRRHENNRELYVVSVCDAVCNTAGLSHISRLSMFEAEENNR